MADEDNHINKRKFQVPFVCGCRNLGEALVSLWLTFWVLLTSKKKSLLGPLGEFLFFLVFYVIVI